jgi:hypothetical protein
VYTGDRLAHCGMFCDASDSFGEVLSSLGRDLNDEAKA